MVIGYNLALIETAIDEIYMKKITLLICAFFMSTIASALEIPDFSAFEFRGEARPFFLNYKKVYHWGLSDAYTKQGWYQPRYQDYTYCNDIVANRVEVSTEFFENENKLITRYTPEGDAALAIERSNLSREDITYIKAHFKYIFHPSTYDPERTVMYDQYYTYDCDATGDDTHMCSW